MRGVAPAVAAIVTTVGLLAGAVAPAPAAAPAPLEQARRAAEETAFEGVLRVQWLEGGVTRSERLEVQAAGGALVVRGANSVMAQPAFGRLLSHAGEGWEEMWLPSLAPAPRPDGVRKYLVTTPADGHRVAGRPTRVVEVHHAGALLERVYLDAQTNLMLERDQYDPSGAVVRTLVFESLTVNPPSARPPAVPRSSASSAPDAVVPERLASPAVAPPGLADGYARMGIYRTGDVLHVLYSDGLYDLSLFQQKGRLRRSDLPPAGEEVAVAGAKGWRYPWPGGQLVVWSTGGRVFTAVSDAPADQVLIAVRSLPGVPDRELSLFDKIRRACQALMEPLS